MAIHLKHNPYTGINAHYNSYLQDADGTWQHFHAKHIVHLSDLLNEQLPPGYYALEEQSLQIQSGFEGPKTFYPDVEIYQQGPQSTSTKGGGGVLASPSPTLEAEVGALRLDDHDLMAILIYNPLGQALTRIELLSPSNKKSPRAYLTMRQWTLESGMALVELDYLHEYPSLFRHLLPDYRQQADSGYPYLIAISDPRPSDPYPQGYLHLYGFHVEDSPPILAIPLEGGEGLRFDFMAAYHYTFQRSPLAHKALDYSLEPLNFHTYSPADQARIRAKMASLFGGGI